MGFREEKAELDAVFASGMFSRAPGLAQILSYVCTKYFEGHADQVKEYNIAVEALGRPADFDQKRDSIVRVEAHRLRKRLNEFYEGEGASHEVKIVMPPGQYVPQFIRTSLHTSPGNGNGGAPNGGAKTGSTQAALTAGSPPGTANLDVLQSGIHQPNTHQQSLMQDPQGALVQGSGVQGSRVLDQVLQVPPRTKWPRTAFVGIGVVAALGLVALSTARLRSNPPIAAATPVIASSGDEIRILAGATGPYTDQLGHTWEPDQYSAGGYIKEYPGAVEGTHDARIFQTPREGEFQYDIPLKPGVYELRLYFAEMLYGEKNAAGGGETSRLFHVDANGKRILSDFDVIADAAGASIADERVFKDLSPADDGRLHLRFTHMVREALLNAIEITPGTSGKLRPIRMVMRDQAYRDRKGSLWQPDIYHRGGQLVNRPRIAANTDDPDLYHGERFGNLTYVIPVASGTYSVTMRFAEYWFGPGKPVGGGAGSRRFDILCNATALSRNFDIYKEAGGSDRALDRTFHGLQPNAQGKLVISMIPIENYASINAMEIIDESKW